MLASFLLADNNNENVNSDNEINRNQEHNSDIKTVS